MSELPFEFEIDVNETHYVALTEIPPHLRAMLAPLVFQSREDGTWNDPYDDSAPGTAFCIVPPTKHHQAVYVTARHMVNAIRDRQHAIPYLLIPKATTGTGTDHLVAVRVDCISITDPPNDLALLRVDVRQASEVISSQFPSATLALRPPNVGENTLALGYPHQKVTKSFRFESELRASHCVVQDDEGNFPPHEFMVTGEYAGGMSGGPVWDEMGGVIGVVSSGMSESLDGDPPYGRADSIGCLGELSLELLTDDGTEFKYSVAEMAHIGLISLQGNHSVTVERRDSEIRLEWS